MKETVTKIVVHCDSGREITVSTNPVHLTHSMHNGVHVEESIPGKPVTRNASTYHEIPYLSLGDDRLLGEVIPPISWKLHLAHFEHSRRKK